MEDIELAINACYKQGNYNIALLKCTSSYPAPIDEANMIMLKDFSNKFGVVVGLSDHTIGSTVPIVATCFGAKIIEKHFILNHSIGGPDASFSMDETEFTQMVKSIRDAERAIGKIDYQLSVKQKRGKDYCRSLYVVEDIKSGEIINKNNIRSIRPGYGLHPKYYYDVLGKIAKKDLEKGDRLSLNDLQ